MSRVPMSTAERRGRRFMIIASVPVIITIGALFVYPMLYAVMLSFYRVNDRTPASNGTVGVGNYLSLLSDSGFQSSLLKTSIFCVFTVFGGVGLTIGITSLLNRRFKGRTVARVLLLVPWVAPPVVNGIMWKVVFDGSYGVINYVLIGLGVTEDRIQWLVIPNLAMGMLALAEIWKFAPFLTLVALASVQAIPANMYHAATIDGASSWRQFWHVLLPDMRGTTMFLLIVQSMWSIKVFDSIYVLTGDFGGPAEATTTVNFLAYLTTFSYLNRGYGAAILLAIMVVVTLVAVLWVSVPNRKGKE